MDEGALENNVLHGNVDNVQVDQISTFKLKVLQMVQKHNLLGIDRDYNCSKKGRWQRKCKGWQGYI